MAAQRHAISFAKAVSTLEAVIGPDRFICGVVAGWNVEEMRNHGVAQKQRWLALRETIEAAIKIWTCDEAEYHGKVVDFDLVRSFPKPATRPHPPILLGGHTLAVLDRVVQFADGWTPIKGRYPHPTIEEIEQGIKFLARKSDELGRDFTTTVCDMRVDLDATERYRDMGVDRFLFGCPPLRRDEFLRYLDDCAKVVRRMGADG